MASIANTVTISGTTIQLVPLEATVLGTGTMTAANPIVVTVASHGLVTGDYVSFTAIAQANWTALNGISKMITKLSANTFSINIDGSGFGAYTDATGAINQDFCYSKYFPNGFFISGGEFKANANDRLIIRDKVYTGPTMYDIVEDGSGSSIPVGGRVSPGVKIKPFIMLAEQVFSQPSTTKIIFEVA